MRFWVTVEAARTPGVPEKAVVVKERDGEGGEGEGGEGGRREGGRSERVKSERVKREMVK